MADKLNSAETTMSSESFQLADERTNSIDSAETEENKSSDIEAVDPKDEVSKSTVKKETNRRFSTPDIVDSQEQIRNKARSLSLKESGTKLPVQRTRRRKCDSESAAFSSTDDEGFEDKVIQFRERDLEKVIGQCVDRLIRESILLAVKSVKVDNLYEDVIKSLSRSSSESSESSRGPENVQQKLQSDSITEYEDLQMMHTFEEEPDETDDSKLPKDSETSSEVSDQSQSNIMNDYHKTDKTETEKGLKYSESEKGLESGVESVEKLEVHKAHFEASESDNCSKIVDNTETYEIGTTKFAENKESSTCTDQNEKTSTDGDTCESNQLEKHIESDRDIVKDKELPENFVYEQAKEVKECQETSVPSENFEVNKSSELVGNIGDCSKRENDSTFLSENLENKDQQVDETDNCKIEIEELKDISVDGYHADIDESVSLHSLASESSLENVVDAENFSRRISDGTEASTQEGNINGQLQTGLEKDTKNVSKLQLDAEDVHKNIKAEADLMAMSGDDFSHLLTTSESTVKETDTPASDLGENLPEQKPVEEEKKVNWKVGYLHVKLPHKSRHKGLKVWKKRCVAIQPDEFTSNDSDPCLVLSVYSGDSSAAKKHSASFWKTISCQKAVIYRSNSRTHPYAFTLSDDKKVVIHLSADSEAISQEWMAAIRAILWPPSPVVQLEKMLNGKEFEISIIDNEFSHHAGLLGMYGYLTITSKKLILIHPQQGYVIQEWYLNTVDKFQLIPQTRIEDVNKVLSMTTCSDSSTGKGDILIYCKEAVSLLQAIASTIHQILTHHSNQEGGKYQKELEEIGAWLVTDSTPTEDYYKVPPKQVKSLLDIPNFIFNKPITPVASVAGTPKAAMDSQKPTMDAPKANETRSSLDSGISSETVSDDFLNCSTTSFVVGGGSFPGKSSDSELSDTYTPPRSPVANTKRETEPSEVEAKE